MWPGAELDDECGMMSVEYLGLAGGEFGGAAPARTNSFSGLQQDSPAAEAHTAWENATLCAEKPENHPQTALTGVVFDAHTFDKI